MSSGDSVPPPGLGSRTRTIRFRVTAVAALAVLLVLAAAGTSLLLAQRALLVEGLDETLEATADEMAELVRTGAPLDGATTPSDDVGVEVVDADGTVLLATPPPDGTAVREVVRDVDGTQIRVAGSLEDVDEAGAVLAWSLVVGVPLSTALLGGVVWWSVGRALRPVEDVRARVEQITGSRLDERVPVPRTDDEIARLARTMNDMLARLEEAADRQRRFVADASHELRSPLARMRAELEVDAAHPASADLVVTHRSVLAEAVGLQRLVDDLLVLARSDAGAVDEPVELVDLDDVVDEVVQRATPRDAAVRVVLDGLPPVQVRGHRSDLVRAVGNLVDNAVRHAESTVRVTLTRTAAGLAELVIADDGPGIPSERAEEVFERFTRLDAARRSGEGGVGLGLPIARDVARRHGGTLVLDPATPRGARFVLALPLSGQPSHRPSLR